MAQIACSYCGADNASEAAYCVRCQRPLKAASAPRPTVRIAARPVESAKSAPPQAAPPPRATVPAARPTQPAPSDLDGPTRVGPPPQFLSRPAAQPPPRPTTSGQPPRAPAAGPSLRPAQRMPPAGPKAQSTVRAAAPAEDNSDKTQITPARLSPLMQRLTPKPQIVSTQQTAMLTPADLQPAKAAQPPPRPAASTPAPAALPSATPRAAAARAQDQAQQEEIVIRHTPVMPPAALRPEPATAPTPPVAPARVVLPAPPTTPVAETVILEVAPTPDIHSEATIIASVPLNPPTPAHRDPTVAERTPASRRETYRNLDASDDAAASAPSRQSVHLPDELINDTEAVQHETTVGARSLAQLPRLALASCLDAGVILATGWAWAATEMLLFDGSWPAERAGVEALAVWMHMYASVALHAAMVTGAFALFYSALGAHDGRTLGRAAMGLTLVRVSGDKPTWPWALWHACASVASASIWGAGTFWMLVDTRRRTWGNLMSGTVICLGSR